MNFSLNRTTYQTPPEGIGVRFKILFGFPFLVQFMIVFLHQVDKKGGQNECQESDIPGCDEFLKRNVLHDENCAVGCPCVHTGDITPIRTPPFITIVSLQGSKQHFAHGFNYSVFSPSWVRLEYRCNRACACSCASHVGQTIHFKRLPYMQVMEKRSLWPFSKNCQHHVVWSLWKHAC